MQHFRRRAILHVNDLKIVADSGAANGRRLSWASKSGMLNLCIFIALSSTPAAVRWPRLVPARPLALQEALAVAGGGGNEVSGAGLLLALYGHVRGRRSLGRNLAFIDIESLDDVEEHIHRPTGGASRAAGTDSCLAVQAILRSSNGPGAAPRAEILCPGALIALLGRAKLSPRGSHLLVVIESRLLTAGAVSPFICTCTCLPLQPSMRAPRSPAPNLLAPTPRQPRPRTECVRRSRRCETAP
jgi:hypothetical protein